VNDPLDQPALAVGEITALIASAINSTAPKPAAAW